MTRLLVLSNGVGPPRKKRNGNQNKNPVETHIICFAPPAVLSPHKLFFLELHWLIRDQTKTEKTQTKN